MRFLVLTCVLSMAGVAAAQPSSTQGLVVETGSPDALCPDVATTRQAVQNRIGTFGGTKGWVVRYTVGHDPQQGSFVRLELIDPSAEVRLVRDLPRDGESCQTLAQAIALVVERYFQELEAPATEPKPAPQQQPPKPPVQSPQENRPKTTLTPAFAVGVEGGFLSMPSGGLVGVHAGYWVTPWLRPQLELGIGLAEQRDRVEGQGTLAAYLRAFPARLTLGLGQRGSSRSPLDWFAGPTIRATLAATHITGEDMEFGGAYWSLGLGAGALWWPWSKVALTLNAAADVRTFGTEFTVGVVGSPKPVLELPPVQFAVSVGAALGVGP